MVEGVGNRGLSGLPNASSGKRHVRGKSKNDRGVTSRRIRLPAPVSARVSAPRPWRASDRMRGRGIPRGTTRAEPRRRRFASGVDFAQPSQKRSATSSVKIRPALPLALLARLAAATCVRLARVGTLPATVCTRGRTAGSLTCISHRNLPARPEPADNKRDRWWIGSGWGKQSVLGPCCPGSIDILSLFGQTS
jgi:hypothetical protein